ncbi:ABC transporter substrate-binding protein [Colwellia sp. MSW7]|uniref:ABC transporter substrate-binding protein n=1 Tax=Colwellia maritima TaxID=2912588 RepID=A0ABS9X419_9GAMM|nr:ABC transporter substrate-binding protein [Colwellia maritima]MCI2284961.1 ABC transporter substrate-binding protein [Colwellia maritima]
MKKTKSVKVALYLGYVFSSIVAHNAFAFNAAQEPSLSGSDIDQSSGFHRSDVNQKDPYAMIKEVAGRTFKRFANEQQAIRVDPNILKTIVREELMPYINYQYSAFKVIGQQLKNTTDEERKEFVPVFREYLVTSYAQVFTLYDKQPVEFAPAEDFTDRKIVAVDTRVIMTGRDNIDVSFKVRKDRQTEEWKAFDMIAEGVSLLDSKQAELGGVIRQKGLPYVTELLKKQSDRDIVFKD